jgi:hypothetical protein
MDELEIDLIYSTAEKNRLNEAAGSISYSAKQKQKNHPAHTRSWPTLSFAPGLHLFPNGHELERTRALAAG